MGPGRRTHQTEKNNKWKQETFWEQRPERGPRTAAAMKPRAAQMLSEAVPELMDFTCAPADCVPQIRSFIISNLPIRYSPAIIVFSYPLITGRLCCREAAASSTFHKLSLFLSDLYSVPGTPLLPPTTSPCLMCQEAGGQRVILSGVGRTSVICMGNHWSLICLPLYKYQNRYLPN